MVQTSLTHRLARAFAACIYKMDVWIKAQAPKFSLKAQLHMCVKRMTSRICDITIDRRLDTKFYAVNGFHLV